MGPAIRLNKLNELLKQDKSLPLRNTATQLVTGDGNPGAKIVFIGEAPGRFEDLQGKPFVGAAGKLLNNLLKSVGLKREDVYITNLVKFRPPNNRPPTPKEISDFRDYLIQELQIIKPKAVVPLGRFALWEFFPGEMISKTHGQVFDLKWYGLKLKILPLYHPAAALRSGKLKETLAKDFKKIRDLL